ncbi:MAG: PaaI family thioesterase [Euryarchaeota archaeon]|nr:PaaI family thioesterase [Euryarchaeota archaeon]MDE1836823.1 PaaI family thioesterase [Euryarchaeota archaeon]MDE1881726.1 PaaI family thioesterase [Euryarchaeota archaeon]MDE2044807.1 PaaI family thioesterase [Thermoplasmata archaeon]
MAKPPAKIEPRPIRPPEDWRKTAVMPGFHRSVGFEIDPAEARPGRCIVRGRIEAMHLNINQVVHGGVYCTLLDTAMGAAVVTTLGPQEVTATTSIYVDFIRPARLGQVLSAEGVVTRRGRNIAFADGKIQDEEGKLMGTGRGTWYIWSLSPEKGPAPRGTVQGAASPAGPSKETPPRP